MTKLSELLLVSDMDGTALIAHQGIPPENIRAARRFVDKGGRFTFATGRSLKVARPVLEQFPVNAPMVLLNGSLIYDPSQDRMLRAHTMGPGVFRVVRELVGRLEGKAGVMMVAGDEYYEVSGEKGYAISLRNISRPPVPCTVDEVPDEVYKILVVMDSAEQTTRMRRQIGEWYGEAFGVVRSGDQLVELLDKGSSKGGTLMELCRMLDIPPGRVAAIGDNENDAEMLRFAGISAVPADARTEARGQADHILCACMDGALAAFITLLENTYQ